MKEAADRRTAIWLIVSVLVCSWCLTPGLRSVAQPAEGSPPLTELLDPDRAPREVRRVLFRAQTYHERDQTDEAIALLAAFVVENPDQDHYLLRYQLGNLFAISGRFAEALPHLEAAVVLEPRLYPAWRNLGEIAYELGQNARAAEAFEAAFALDPEKTPELLYYAAANWMIAGHADRAVPLYEELIAESRTAGRYEDPRMAWYRGLLGACLELDTPQRAAPAMAELVARDHSNPDAWQLAAQQATAAGDYRRAAVALTIKSFLRPLTYAEQVQLGDLYGAIDVPVAAAQYYAAAVADSATAEGFERLAAAYLAGHELDRAAATLTEALAVVPNARLWSLAGDVRYLKEDYRAALEAYRETVRRDPEAGRAFLMAGYCALELEDRQQAATLLRRAAEFPGQAASAQRLLASLADR
jgi:tetratricopeptide (TPR) repeat protein